MFAAYWCVIMEGNRQFNYRIGSGRIICEPEKGTMAERGSGIGLVLCLKLAVLNNWDLSFLPYKQGETCAVLTVF